MSVKSNMISKALLAVSSLACLFSFCAFSQNRSVKRLDIEVVLNKDGSADFTQYWEVTSNTVTEWFYPILLSDNMVVSDLRVEEDSVAFSMVDDWKVERTLEEKKGLCGVVEKGKNNVELCWGFGDYGEHSWKVTFHVIGLVQSYDDYDGFRFRFISRNLAGDREFTSVSITTSDFGPINPGNTKIRTEGFVGDAEVLTDGSILAIPDGYLEGREELVLVCRFNKGIFAPDMSRHELFYPMQENLVKDSSSGKIFKFILLFIPILVAIFWMIFNGTILGRKYSKRMYGHRKIDARWPDIPLDGNIAAITEVYKNGWRFGAENSEDTLVGAYFLKWILEKAIRIIVDPEKSTRLIMLFTGVAPDFENDPERVLFECALEAAGPDMRMTCKDFENWTSKHRQDYLKWPDSVSDAAQAWLKDRKILETHNRATTQGRQETIGVIALKNYLTDFVDDECSYLDDNSHWKEYIIFSQLMGLSERLVEKLRAVSPPGFESFAEERGMNSEMFAAMVSAIRSMSTKVFMSPFDRKFLNHRSCDGC